jgi:twitching motility two-component system response regulator PilH
VKAVEGIDDMNTLSIVLIDDSLTQAQQIAAFMSGFDIDVLMATDPRQGLRLIVAHQPDAIVMDLNMPYLNGFQLCRRLKRDDETAHIPVIMVTSSDDEQDVMTGIEVGVDRYLLKDSNLAENLLTTLRELKVTF